MRALLVVLCLTLAACGLLHLGSTNADGSPKTSADALQLIRELGDAALITYGSDWLRDHAPGAVQMFDDNEDGRLTLAEIENHVDLSTPGALTNVLVIGIQLYEARRAHEGR